MTHLRKIVGPGSVCLAVFMWLITLAPAGAVTTVLPKAHPEHPGWSRMPRTGILPESSGLENLDACRVDTTEAGMRAVPDRVDNSEQPYFRGIFSQVNGSCSQASAVGYIFTYEVDWVRGVAADTEATRYPSHFTYNFLNNGLDWASDPFDGWGIVQECGVPDQAVYGGLAAGGFTRWMTGYDNYFHAMQNRLYSTSFVETAAEEGLLWLKEWFDNHADGSAAGGVALFGANTIGLEADTLPAGTPDEGAYVIRWWGPQGQFLVDHLMTFVGYDDTICLDYNNDGRYTNDEDTNGDGVVDMTDWEVGAMIIANSWGTGWANGGFIYMPYRLLAVPVADHGMGLYNRSYTITPLETYSPLLTMKITLTHSCRDKIKVTCGISPDPAAETPAYRLQLPIFNYQGGPNYMQGGTDESDRTIEFGLDISRLLAHVSSGEASRIFLEVTENDPDDLDQGSIDAWSVVDYTSGSPREIIGGSSSMNLVNNGITRAGVTTTISYDAPDILTAALPGALVNAPYSEALSAAGGSPPYTWRLDARYMETTGDRPFPAIGGHRVETAPNTDDGYARVALEFEFPFFSDRYSAVTASTDGSITFTDEFPLVRNLNHLRNTAAITPLGGDLQQFPDEGGGIFVDSHSDHAVIRWISGRYGHPEDTMDFAVVLHDTGRIEFCYGDSLTTGFGFISGISDGTGNLSLSSISGASEIADGLNLLWHAPDYALDPAPGMNLTTGGMLAGTPVDSRRVWQLPVMMTDINGLTSSTLLPFMCHDGHAFVTLRMEDDNLSPGDQFRLVRECGNPPGDVLTVDEYVILDVYGAYWFWPGWTQSVDFVSGIIAEDSCNASPVLEFEWPDVSGSAPGLRFWCGLLETGTVNLVDYTMIEWEYGDGA